MRKSTDGGQSFTAPERELVTGIVNAEGTILGGAFPKAHSWPFVAVDPLNGSLNMVYGNGTNIYFSNSTDNGNDWSTPVVKYVVPSFANQVWNPSIACNSQGKIAIAYYAAYWYQGASLNNSTSVLVATSSDGGGTFTIHSEGAVAFNPTTWKYSDYIGVAYNNSTYWGVWPQAVGTGADIDGRYRTVTAVVENVDDSPQRNAVGNKVSFDQTSNWDSPHSAGPLLPGRSHSIGTSSSIPYQGITYTFVRWEDETGAFISNSLQTSVQIESHRYRAVFSKYMVNVAVKNEFKEPNGAVNNGGTVNIDTVDYVTDNLPGKQKTFTAPQGEQHTFKANEQTWAAYYRGFNTYSQHDGGWLYPDLVTRSYIYSLTTGVQPGPYTAKYRNRYTVHINGSTPETGSTLTDITSPQNVWQYESGVTAASQITSGGRTFQFYGWSDGATANPDPNPPTNNTTYTALYKGVHISSDASAFSNNSERKFVRTTVGTVNWLHQVYTSMGHVWIEHSTDGVNWTLGNGGQPLDNGSGKCPSIDFYGTTLVVAFQQQETSPNTYTIRLATFIPYSGSYIRQAGPNQLPAYFETSDPYSTNSNPSIAWGQGYYYLVAFERKSTTAGISYVCGVINPDGTPYAWGQGGPFHVNGTNGNSIYPTVHSNRWASYTGAEFELAYEQYTASYSSSINETPINVLYSANWNRDTVIRLIPGKLSSVCRPT